MTDKAPVQARAELDVTMFGVRIAVRDHDRIAHFEPVTYSPVAEGGPIIDDTSWLRLTDEQARAIYEALADYFGHSGNDTKALRRDYEAERARVDQLIGYATRSVVTS